MDMWKPYQNAVKATCPHAARVFDRFHVAKKTNDAVDQVRRAEWRHAEKARKTDIKGLRSLLLKRPEKLDESGAQRLRQALALNENLSKAYIAAEQVRGCYQSSTQTEMDAALDDTIAVLAATELAPMKQLAKTLDAHRDGITAYAEHPISTGALEGMNTKISALQRRGYGYRDFEYFRLKVLQLTAQVPLLARRDPKPHVA